MKILKLFIISLLLSGCSIPVRLVISTNPAELAREEEIRQEGLVEGRSSKMRARHANRLAKKIAKKEKLKAEKKRLKEEAAQERNQILRVLNKDQDLILKACEKAGLETFMAAKWINAYGGSDLEEFLDYIDKNEILGKIFYRWALERGFRGQAGPFAEIRSAHTLLLKLERSQDGEKTR